MQKDLACRWLGCKRAFRRIVSIQRFDRGTYMLRRIWPATLLLTMSCVALAASTTGNTLHYASLSQRELTLVGTLGRASQFVDVPHVSSPLASCGDVQPPEALATPDPLLTPNARGRKVKVSFIIGTDGRVHSPLILESAGVIGDWHVLQTVRTWRYRPATCNGVPTETEGKVEFSSR
jgi:TonB family protein